MSETKVVERHGTDFRTLFDRDYIGAFDLQGRDITVTISKVVGGELTAMGGRKSRKPILYFAGKERGMIMNKTNSKTVAALYGNFVEGWVNKRVTIFVGMTRDPSTGGECECLRIRPVAPPDKEAKLAQPATEDNGP